MGKGVSIDHIKGGAGGPVQFQFKFDSQLRRVLLDIRKNGENIIGDGVEDAAEIALRIWAKHRITGDMLLSIRTIKPMMVFEKNGKLKVSRQGIYAENPAAHLEFGTRHQKAQPGLVPAIVLARDNVLDRIGNEGLV